MSDNRVVNKHAFYVLIHELFSLVGSDIGVEVTLPRHDLNMYQQQQQEQLPQANRYSEQKLILSSSSSQRLRNFDFHATLILHPL